MNTYYIIVLYIKKEPLRNYSEQDLFVFLYCKNCILLYFNIFVSYFNS